MGNIWHLFNWSFLQGIGIIQALERLNFLVSENLQKPYQGRATQHRGKKAVCLTVCMSVCLVGYNHGIQ